MDLAKICKQVRLVAERTGNFIRKESESFRISDAKLKGQHDFVSYVDLQAEKQLVKELTEVIPGAGFLTEEGTAATLSEDYNWVIDPLDGTTNFMHGVPPYSISIALTLRSEPVMGVVHEIASGEMYYAWKDGGSWLNGKRITVSEAAHIEDCLVATGFPFKNYERVDNYMHCLEYFIRNTHGVRRHGSAAIDLAWVACGRFDAFYEYGLNKWDVAAGIIIIREAGGMVSDFGGNTDNISGKEIVATNKRVYDEFRSKVSELMKGRE